MIERLRRRHRRMAVGLAATLPLGLAAALVLRPAPPGPGPLPEAFRDPDGALRVVFERGDLFGEPPVRVRLLEGGGRRAVELAPQGDVPYADVLVYWAPGAAEAEGVPDGACLIGRLAGRSPRTLLLPPEAAAGGGRLLLYSLGHQRLVAQAPLEG